MSEKNDPDKKIENNDAPSLKPNHVHTPNLAPPGMVGTTTPSGYALTANRPNTDNEPAKRFVQNRSALGRSESDYEQDQPIALKTGDREVDEHTAKTHRLISEKEFERLKKEAIKDKLQSDRGQSHGRDP